jgi:hypothetical protein
VLVLVVPEELALQHKQVSLVSLEDRAVPLEYYLLEESRVIIQLLLLTAITQQGL